ncbi:BglG family transcription antiterminator [Lactobacillus mulieris]|uniref:BglG family transcription antiterminator n=1 Tax=Lactobacillus mulieris TaxID=2508708 RepID=UPI0014334047|nr:BglG family transcription antiterminator [Lactobacillus mulieris]MCF1783645.1 BglG family transcription antiterminator [Lactobacillus mulieris]MCW8104267.1 BglG family transcription antiterminator [Lactobacillus mulieris]MDK6803127.1 BglG family transcription antiterminator [Lactobacillus mulieris]MDK8382243.1 BglG family transcription antiterminator [Lactobacillus mulieris]MDT9620385.1 BglG family transcription antiterminator [Lactobacillus mulieris]
MKQQLYELLNLLSNTQFQTGKLLADKLSLSDKTVRNRLKDLNKALTNQGAEVISKHHYGYKLNITNKKRFLSIQLDNNHQSIPDSTEERVKALLITLLNTKEYLKIDDLANRLYVSRKTLSSNLKHTEKILSLYKLKIDRRPNYGIKVVGTEFDKRNCLSNNAFDYYQEYDKHQQLINIVIASNQKDNTRMSEVALESFVKYLLISIKRISSDYRIKRDIGTTDISPATMKIIDELVIKISGLFNMKFSEIERKYLAIQYSATLSSDTYSQYGPNFVITSKIDELVFEMLNRIYETFGLDYRNNLELRMSLNQHLVPMDIRMRYMISVKNPLLNQIKRQYSFPYALAETACQYLQAYYNHPIPEDEKAYIAIIFALATEKRNLELRKKNIVLVCISGTSSSQLFKYKYLQAFGQYINKIYNCTVTDLDKFDFKGKHIDYIFTTVPLTKTFPVPIYEINLFINTNDILTYKELFENGDKQSIIDKFPTNLFMSGVKANSKEEVIDLMCRKVAHYGLIDKNFKSAVLKRESLGQTDFGNLTAIPHPYKLQTEKSFVIVAILDKPIIWTKNKVQVIFLLSLGKEEKSTLTDFYQKISDIVFDKNAIQQLINNPQYETLIQILK